MSQAMEMTVGLMRPDELGYVANSWKLSLQDAPQNERKPNGVFFGEVNYYFDAIMKRPGTQVLVARDANNPRFILGYLCVERAPQGIALHWAYTRPKDEKRVKLRERGVCSFLLEHALAGAGQEPLFYTSSTRFDDMWANWGFEYVDLVAWLRGAKQ